MASLPHWAILTLAWIGLVLSMLALFNVAVRRIPPRFFARWESTRPRLAAFLRFNRAIGPDVDKGLRQVPRIAFGTTLPAVLARLIVAFLAPQPDPSTTQPATSPPVPTPTPATPAAPVIGGPS